jgi:hypothetical protein
MAYVTDLDSAIQSWGYLVAEGKIADSELPPQEKQIQKRCMSRGWFGTLNNPTTADWMVLKYLTFHKNIRFISGQLELGKGGTYHLQFYLHGFNKFDARSTFPRAHMEVARHDQACISYVQKYDTRVIGPFQWGDAPHQGEKKP